jgi:chlorobactene glucosyltransferase
VAVAGAVLPALPWVLPWLALPRLADRSPVLADAPRRSGQLLSVVVPARNEERNVLGVLASLRASTYPDLEIILVDDRSDDRTPVLAEVAAADDPRIRVVRGDSLPEGWYGKPWACVQGYRAARGALILFTDADTRHAPAVLEHAVGALERERADLVTIVTGLDCLTFWERVAMPQFFAPLGLRYHPLRVNAARRERDVIANGQFILVRREAYERVGTHEAVRGEVGEDLALAQAFHRAGCRSWMGFADELVRTRMYTSLEEILEGWSKNFLLGGRLSFTGSPALAALLPLAAVWNALFWLFPLFWLAFSGLSLPSLLAFLLASGFWALLSKGMGIPAEYGLLHPFGAAVFLAVVVRSTWRGDRRVEWRGRTYDQTEWAGG